MKSDDNQRMSMCRVEAGTAARDDLFVVVDLLEFSPWDLPSPEGGRQPDLRVVVLSHHERLRVLKSLTHELRRAGAPWELEVWFEADDSEVDRWVRRRGLQGKGEPIRGFSVQASCQTLAHPWNLY